MTQPEHIPAHNLEAERALIGSVLVDHDILDSVADVVRGADFYAHVHETIWKALVELHAEKMPLDKITVAERLRARDELDRVGGLSYVSSLMDTIQTAGSARYYALIVAEKSKLRGLVSAGMAIAQIGYDGEEDVLAALSAAQRALSAVLDRAATKDGDDMRSAIARYRSMMASDAGLSYLTPWPRLDKLTGGFTADELVVWAADPGVGKSMALVMLAAYDATMYGPVAFFATEMGTVKTIARFIALYSGISARRQREHDLLLRGEQIYGARPLSQYQLDKIAQAEAIVQLLCIRMFDGRMSFDELAAQCRRMHRQRSLKAIMVDTLGKLVSGTPRLRNESKHELQERVVDSLKFLAEELMVPVHVAHHLNRNDRSGQRPSKKNLRDGGNLEGTATTIIFPHKEPIGNDIYQHLFIVDKARDGSEHAITMKFDGSTATWLEEDQDRPFCMDPEPIQTDAFGERDDALAV